MAPTPRSVIWLRRRRFRLGVLPENQRTDRKVQDESHDYTMTSANIKRRSRETRKTIAKGERKETLAS